MSRGSLLKKGSIFSSKSYDNTLLTELSPNYSFIKYMGIQILFFLKTETISSNSLTVWANPSIVLYKTILHVQMWFLMLRVSF